MRYNTFCLFIIETAQSGKILCISRCSLSFTCTKCKEGLSLFLSGPIRYLRCQVKVSPTKVIGKIDNFITINILLRSGNLFLYVFGLKRIITHFYNMQNGAQMASLYSLFMSMIYFISQIRRLMWYIKWQTMQFLGRYPTAYRIGFTKVLWIFHLVRYVSDASTQIILLPIIMKEDRILNTCS